MAKEDPTVSAKELARILGVTSTRIHQLVREGVLEKTSRARFDLAAAVQTYIAYKTPEPSELSQRARLDKIKADRAELEYEKERGQLIDVNKIGPLWESTFANYRQRLDAVPVKAAPLVKGQSLAKIKEIIEDLIRDAVNDFAGTAPGVVANTPSTGRGQKAAKANGQRVGGRKKAAKPGGKRRAG